MEDKQDSAAEVQIPVATTPVNNSLKQLTFWPANVAMWFTSTDGVFLSLGYYLAAAQFLQWVCPHLQSRGNEPATGGPIQPSLGLLLTPHQLMNIQRVVKLLALPPLSKQEPLSIGGDDDQLPWSRGKFCFIVTSFRSCRESSVFCCPRLTYLTKAA